MAVKKFISAIRKKDQPKEQEAPSSEAPPSNSEEDSGTFSTFTFGSRANSLFSRANETFQTKSTNVSSQLSKRRSAQMASAGKPLRILNEEEPEIQNLSLENEPLDENDIQVVETLLNQLAANLNDTVLQIAQSSLNFTRAAIVFGEKVDQTCSTLSGSYTTLLKKLSFGFLSTDASAGLRKVVKLVLFMIDCVVVEDAYANSRAVILHKFGELLLLLKLIEKPSGSLSLDQTFKPSLFPITNVPHHEVAPSIMDQLLCRFGDCFLADQEGSFIAPVLRGFNESLCVVTFVFGFPEVSKEHRDVVSFFYSLYEDVHFMCQKNFVSLASFQPSFKAPFRIPPAEEPPMSVSLSGVDSMGTSGTLGGYIYPKIPENSTNKVLHKYRDSSFGLTCAHVVLNELEPLGDYPEVSVPSAVLISVYRKALANERDKFLEFSQEYNAYDKVVKEIDFCFPLEKVKVFNKKLNEKVLVERNLSPDKFGHIIWGERVIVEHRLSDMAVIKINNEVEKKCLNFLGNDVSFNEFDPSLMFSNLYVKKVVDLNGLAKPKTDSSNETVVGGSGLSVFKYGSTTKYTKGAINGVKMVYWSNGKMQSSEFVVKASQEGNSMGFASGGDSGSWILCKLEELNNYDKKVNRSLFNTLFGKSFPSVPTETGLGVIGMLHSFDGEMKQFGLFTPMQEILDRLETVTHVKWDVVGCGNDDVDEGEDEKLVD